MTGKNKNTAPNKTLIAIPVFNERRYINDIIAQTAKYAENILIVNDGSDDGTERLLRNKKTIKVITHKKNLGYGQSIIDSFDYALIQKYDWIITMDCDYQHQPSHLPHFFATLEQNSADIISGSRYLCPDSQNHITPPPNRAKINKEITNILNTSLNLNISDAFCGFKAYRVESLGKLNLTEKGYALPLQLWIQAARAGLKFCEISVPLIYHDPNRNFTGLLSSDAFRLEYYLNVIDRELAANDHKNAR